jgi:hypothetical protein
MTAAIALLAGEALAQDIPSLVGTWAVPNQGRPVSSHQAAENAALTVKILRQDGDSFSGTVTNLKGKAERFSGAFRRDRATFVYSSEKTAGTGRVQGNQMEICRTDAPCVLLVRGK